MKDLMAEWEEVSETIEANRICALITEKKYYGPDHACGD